MDRYKGVTAYSFNKAVAEAIDIKKIRVGSIYLMRETFKKYARHPDDLSLNSNNIENLVKKCNIYVCIYLFKDCYVNIFSMANLLASEDFKKADESKLTSIALYLIYYKLARLNVCSSASYYKKEKKDFLTNIISLAYSLKTKFNKHMLYDILHSEYKNIKIGGK